MCNKAAALPESDRPRLIMRLSFLHAEPEIWKRLFPILVENKACSDEVWFSTGGSYTDLAIHREKSALIAKYAEDLRANGIVPSIQIQATLGHGDRGSIKTSTNRNWTGYVGVNGEQCKTVNCPRQPGFLKYLQEMSEIYAQWHPGSVWIDDDLRFHNHYPALDPCGCYCPTCLEYFGKEEGHFYTREELVAAYEKDAGLYKRWEDFTIRSLEQVAQVIIETFMRISPETRVGLQHCNHQMRLPLFEVFKKYSGKRVGSRPGGGAYTDHFPLGILSKALLVSQQIADQPGYETISQICPEIESCPRTFSCKTAQGHRLESLLYLSTGSDSLSYFIMDPRLETPEWYGRELLAPLAAEAPCYKEYIQHNENTFPGGLGTVYGCSSNPPVSQIGLGWVPNFEDVGLYTVGNAVGFCSPGSSAWILCADVIDKLTDQQLIDFFKEGKGCILNGKALWKLQERNLEYLVGNIKAEPLDSGSLEQYTDDPINDGLESRELRTYDFERYVYKIPEDLKVRTIGVFQYKEDKETPATVIFQTPYGGRCALLGLSGFCSYWITSDRVMQLNRIVDWVSNGTLPVLLTEALRCTFIPRVTADNQLRSVVILNPTIDFRRSFEILLRGVPENIKEAEYLVPSEERVKVALHHENGVCRVRIPRMVPWEIGWLKIPGC